MGQRTVSVKVRPIPQQQYLKKHLQKQRDALYRIIPMHGKR